MAEILINIDFQIYEHLQPGERDPGTREVRHRGQRTEFEIVTLAGQTALLATKWPEPTFTEEIQFGQYRINLTGLNAIAVPALDEAAATGRVVIVDEIGPMELLSPLFYQAVQQILDSRAAVIGTIVQRPYPKADQVKTHPRVTLLQVTLANRDLLVAQFETELSHWVKQKSEPRGRFLLSTNIHTSFTDKSLKG